MADSANIDNTILSPLYYAWDSDLSVLKDIWKMPKMKVVLEQMGIFGFKSFKIKRLIQHKIKQ